nr:hypothetical protein [Tanacetum cinerariifolium]
MNAGELLKMDPYEEVAQQGQAHPLSPAYVPDLMELDEHVPVYVLEPEHPKYHAPSDDDIQTPMATSTHALIDAFASGSSPFLLPPTSPAYDQVQLGRRAAMIRRRDDILEEDMPPQRRFALTGHPPGCDVAESSAAAAARAPRSQYNFIDTVEAGQEDVGYVRALQASERMMMTSIEEFHSRVSYQAQVRMQESANFYTQLLDAQTDRRDIRLEIDVVRGQRTAYETELQEHQSAEDLAVTQMMHIHTLKARARADTV